MELDQVQIEKIEKLNEFLKVKHRSFIDVVTGNYFIGMDKRVINQFVAKFAKDMIDLEKKEGFVSKLEEMGIPEEARLAISVDSMMCMVDMHKDMNANA